MDFAADSRSDQKSRGVSRRALHLRNQFCVQGLIYQKGQQQLSTARRKSGYLRNQRISVRRGGAVDLTDSTAEVVVIMA